MVNLIWCVFVFMGFVGVKSDNSVTHYSNAFDKELYARVLDEDKCMRQLRILTNHTLGLQFIDASAKIPSGILMGNLNDLGDYYECLDINQVIDGVDIQGKYCGLTIPMIQDVFVSPDSSAWNNVAILLSILGMHGDLDYVKDSLLEANSKMKASVYAIGGFTDGDSGAVRSISLTPFNMEVGICIPHACTTKQVVDHLITKNIPILNLSYTEDFCRLPNDKPFVVADYVAMVIFSIIGIITIISTSYDVSNVFILKKDQSQLSKLYTSFSIYTNTRRVLTFKKSAGDLECVEGIRTLSMVWVVVGHTYCMVIMGHVHNTRYLLEWTQRFSSSWLNSGPITVDTFFFLSGMLCIYSTVGKFSRARFIKNIHMYYLLRLLRMFPLLAVVVLLQASFFHHVSDGPFWTRVAGSTEFCRHYWWSAFLHIQNYVNQEETCITPSWYLAVDVQLYILSPLVIVWLFGKKFVAWTALTVAIILSLIATSYYSFTYNFGSVLGNPSRFAEFPEYTNKYYLNTITRGSSFCVGMAFGYLLHLYRDKRPKISKVNVNLLWTLSLSLLTLCILSSYPAMQADHDLQIYDNILNSYMRAVWAAALGWVVFACANGYGGPINWFLSLDFWKLPSRLTYGVYLLHSPIIIMIQGGWVKTHTFSDLDGFYRFISDATLSFILSFILTVLIDSPCSTLLKLSISGKIKPESTLTLKPEAEKNYAEDKFYKTSL